MEDPSSPRVPAGGRGPFMTAVFQAFLDHASDQGYLIFSDAVHADEYVQFKRSNGVVYGEVGSRQWMGAPERDRPLPGAAETALAGEGFTHGGPERNYVCDDLAASAPYLAQLTDRLFRLAYGSRDPGLPQVESDVPAVCALVERLEGPLGSSFPPQPFDREAHYRRLWEPLRTGPGLAHRAGRALRSNFFDQHLDTEEVVRFRAAVEAVERYDELPEWAREWIHKAEQGPLRVNLSPPPP